MHKNDSQSESEEDENESYEFYETTIHEIEEQKK